MWSGSLRGNSPTIARSTGWLYDHYHEDKKYITKLRVPLCKPLQYIKKDLGINPYIVGALLADGCIGDSEGNISQSCHTDDFEFFKDQYHNAGITDMRTHKHKGSNCHSMYITRGSK